jgi:ribosomal protein S18 acetylase RimI-like enzyme
MAGIPDTDLLAALGRETFQEMWQPFYSPADLSAYLDDAFSSASLRAELELPLIHRYFLVEVAGSLAGYAKLRVGTQLDEFTGYRAGEIERFYFFRTHHGSGAAHALMEIVLDAAVKEGLDWVYLGVDINNHRAIRFYQKYGFEVFGRKEFRVGNQVDIDQLMKRELK